MTESGKQKELLSRFGRGLLNSYSQVFFSDHLVFAVILVLVSFVDVYAGIAGMLSVLVTNLTGYLLKLHNFSLTKGLYGFNSLLVGLGLGIYYQFSLELCVVLIIGAILTLLIALSVQGVLGKYGLPILSVPFILSFWILTLATRQFEALGISERGIYTLNDLYTIGGNTLVSWYEWGNNLQIWPVMKVYLISLGAIFFQYNLLAGVLIALGLLIYSRIAFSLSLLGFFTAWGFYRIFGANITETGYSYIGFNYILTAIATGGFFIIPSAFSYLATFVLIPLVAIVTISLSSVFATFGLPVYSLPFNMIVLLFLYALKFRTSSIKGLNEVYVQQNSPEKNLYAFQNDIQRFKNRHKVSINLPFMGEWMVSQGHEGNYTHKEGWKHAWDFVIVDNEQRQFRNAGDLPEDYYCYNKIVTAPADGTVEEVIDNIEDNIIGQVNLNQNWGNVIIIKHDDYLYSTLAHLKEGSIKVSKGDAVKAGQYLANSGNSGRSPYPHLHFQLQATPFVGSKTLDYPVSHYLTHNDQEVSLLSYSVPEKNQVISNVKPTLLLSEAFNFIPGKEISFEVNAGHHSHQIKWAVKTNVYNQSYINCEESKSQAYFENDGTMFYFTHFRGSKKSLLYYFFLSAYKVQSGFYKGLRIEDKYPVNLLFHRYILFFQDFVAPFFLFLRSKYLLIYQNIDNAVSPSSIELQTCSEALVLGSTIRKVDIKTGLGKNGIDYFEITDGNKKIKATCLG
ncbi:MAG TPA: urea transporter [Bacteroidales bacterium]|nr:urea transporter [Bacteroidales bacterium]